MVWSLRDASALLGCCRAPLAKIHPAPEHVELPPRRGESVLVSLRRQFARSQVGEVCPGPGGRVVDMQVLEVICAQQGLL